MKKIQIKRHIFITTILLITLFVVFSDGIKIAKATDSEIQKEAKPWAAKKGKQSYKKFTIEAGKAATFWVEFKNAGTQTWEKDSKHFVALNVTNPAGRTSQFQHPFWKQSYRPAVMRDKTVVPGKKTKFVFALQAPETPGTYQEDFGLVAENLTWIKGGNVHLTIEVVPPLPAYQAKKTKQSFEEINVAPGKEFTFWVEFKNTGSATWNNTDEHFIALNTTDPSGRVSPFQDESWGELTYRPTKLKQDSVKPGAKGKFIFVMQAPLQTGSYVESFNMVAENLTWIEGGKVIIPINVIYNPEGVDQEDNGPKIQVGLYETGGEATITSVGGSAYLVDAANQTLDTIAAGEIITLQYNAGIYTALTPRVSQQNTQAFSVKAADANTVLQITNYENRPSWNPNLNDNMFRDTLSLRFNEKKQTLWMVNDLSLESYLRGIAEAGNENDEDYLKALLTAARTYALYLIQHPTKHSGEPFIVDSSSNDQVYRGYGFEYRSPNITAAVKATKGMVVTYNKEVVVTPYFSQSDGRTRAWEEVWAGGPKDWLKSVSDPCCSGKTLLGHGIGMSAAGARYFAEAGQTWDAILKYYYTGVDIIKLY